MQPVDTLVTRIEALAGGRDRARVIATLAAVLALDTADKGAVGATARNLQAAFSIGKTELGLLITVSSLVGAAATLPFGSLVDRVRRTRLLVSVIGLWGVAMVVSASALSFTWLLLSRLFLGAVTAAAYPAVASLVGDWFPRHERARILGLILGGELVGTGLGIAVSGGVASFTSWRVAFAVLALPAAGVAWIVSRLDEPARDGASCLTPEEGYATDGKEVEHEETTDEASAEDDQVSVRSLVHDAGVDPAEDEVLREDPAELSLWSAIRYVLGIRTNVALIVSSALGYYLFGGVRAFGIEYAERHYGIGQGLASMLVFLLGGGALVGVVVGGRVADRMLERGRLDARLVVPAVAFIAVAATLAPALIVSSLLIALPLLAIGGFFLAAANPPQDAARLDVVPGLLWGRAEAARTVARTTLEALAPVVFGFMADHTFGGGGRGLQATFIIMLVPLIASAVVLLMARSHYVTDVATAEASLARANAA